MRFDNEGIALWFGTPDAPGPGETVPAGAEAALTVAVHPGDRSNKVEVCHRINDGSDETVTATWWRNDASANVQYFRARLPACSAGDTIEFIPVCRRAGRTAPCKDDFERARVSLRVAEIPPEVRSEAPTGKTDPVVVERVEQPAPATRAPILKEVSPETNAAESPNRPFIDGNVLVSAAIAGVPAAIAKGPGDSAVSNGTAAAPQNPAADPSHEIRIETLNAILPPNEHKEAVKTAFQAANGDGTAALASLKDKLPQESFKKVELAHSLAVWADDNVPVVKAVLAAHPDATNLRDVALHFNVEKLTAAVDPKAVPEATPGNTPNEKHRNFAVGLRQKLFSAEPTAVLHRMVRDAEIPIADANVRSGVTQFLSNQPNFNIRTTSVYTALQHPEAFKDIADEHDDAVVDHLKTLQRVQAISPVPEAVPALINANLDSAFHVAEKPESTFVSAFSPTLGEDTVSWTPKMRQVAKVGPCP
jgi:hypothetical protein